LLVYGPPGAGKKTRISCLLRELYGEGAQKVLSNDLTKTALIDFLSLVKIILFNNSLKLIFKLLLRPLGNLI
jgi:DNA polymerase III delta prime subunit